MEQIVAKKVVRNLEKLVDITFLTFLLVSVLYGAYMMWETNQMYNQASSIAYAPYRPTQEHTYGFYELQEINPDVFGWITVFGTNIDYPLLQGRDNIKYVYANARGQTARSGAIFLDFRNNQDLSDFNNIIYGHDMTRDAMFGEIANFQETYFFESRRFGTVFNGENHYGIEFFAFLEVDAYDFEIYNPFVRDESSKRALIERLEEDAIHYRDLNLTVDDRLVVLSTCTPTFTNGRHLLVGRLMTDIPHDAFAGEALPNMFDFLGMNTSTLILFILLVFVLTVSITLLILKKQKIAKVKKGLLPEIEVVAPPKIVTSVKGDILFLVGKILLVATIIGVIFTVVFGVYFVSDSSMLPAVTEGDIVLFQRVGNHIVANDLVVVEVNGNRNVRRVVATPGDVVNISGGNLIINGRVQQEALINEDTEYFIEGVEFPLTVGYGEFFALGDSRGRARDSRIYGSYNQQEVLGSVVTIIRNNSW